MRLPFIKSLGAKVWKNRHLELVMRVSVKNQISEKYELSREVWIPDAWIIERERRRKQEKENRERPCLQLPVPSSEPHVDEDEDESQAGSSVIVIDL